MNEKEIEKTSIWCLYEKMRNFNNLMNVYADTDRNYRMYNGNQWYGLKVEGVETVSLNIIKSFILFKFYSILKLTIVLKI